MTTTKITKRDRYNSIIEVLNSVNADADLIAFCENEIALLDRKATKAKEVAQEKKAEVDTLQLEVEKALATLAEGDYATTADITAMIAGGDEEITASKVSYRLTKLVNAGIVEKTDVKVATEGGKARTVKAYRLILA